MKKFSIIFIKEIRDCIRDRRSIVMMILPLLIFPLLLTGYNLQTIRADKNISEQLVLATNDNTTVPEITDVLESNNVNVKILETENPTDDLKVGKISLILNKKGDGYHIIYNQNSITSTKAANLVALSIETSKMASIHSVFYSLGVDTEFLSSYNYTLEDFSETDEDSGNSMIALLGPMLIVMFIATGSSGIAVDMFCGEKERGSLEAILSTQVNRKVLYFAKTMAVLVFVCFSTLISISGYLITFVINNIFTENSMFVIKLSWSQIFLLLLIIAVFAFFTTTVICALSIGSKTIKEGSLKINIFTLLPTLLGGATMYMETGTSSWVINIIPFINVISTMKAVFTNTMSTANLWITVLSTMVYGAIFLLLGYRLINREDLLTK